MTRRDSALAANAADRQKASDPDRAARRRVNRTNAAPVARMRGGEVIQSGGATLADVERSDALDALRMGAVARERQLAASIIATCDALTRDGHADLADYRMPESIDPLTGEPVQRDARDVLADADERAVKRWQDRAAARAALADPDAVAALSERELDALRERACQSVRLTSWSRPRDGRRMADADVWRIASYGASCASRMARPRLSREDWQDARQDVALAMLRRDGSASVTVCGVCHGPARALAPITDDHGSTVYAPRCLRHAGAEPRPLLDAGHATPRWDAIRPDDAPDLPPDARENPWRGFAYREAQDLIGKRHARIAPLAMDAESASDLAWEHVTRAMDRATPEIDALAAAADSRLTLAERDALSLALNPCTCTGKRCTCGGVSRATLAAARGTTAQTVKDSAKQGRKLLRQRRMPTLADLRKWVRRANAIDRDALDALAEERSATRRLMTHAAPPYRGVALHWPDRIPTVADDGEYVIPPAPTGKGTRAPVTVDWHGWAPMPHATTGRPADVLRWIAHVQRGADWIDALTHAPRATIPTDATYSTPRTGHAPDPLSPWQTAISNARREARWQTIHKYRAYANASHTGRATRHTR